MSSLELLACKDALSHRRFDFGESEVIRVSLKSPDLYVSEFGQVEDPFVIDKTKIGDSKATRRLALKTQVVFSPDNPHIRTRYTHTGDVRSVAESISNILGLNDKLTEAIALGHDIGHAPAGHLFERVIKKDFGIEFKHEVFGAILATFIERKGSGLNLTEQTINGILNHSQDSSGHLTEEARVVMYSDKIAYIADDIKDLARIGVFTNSDFEDMHGIFPLDSPYNNQRLFVSTCIKALVIESAQKGFVSFEDSQVAQNFKKLKKYMYGHYARLDSKLLNQTISSVVSEVSNIKNYDPVLITAMMTDSEVKFLYDKIISSHKIDRDDISRFGVGEIIQEMDLENYTYQDLVVRLHQKVSF
jgi:dGTP triphosphohydrolase